MFSEQTNSDSVFTVCLRPAVGWARYVVCPKSNENDLKKNFIEHTCNYSLSPSK
jgi:hypothetical protein